MRSTDIRAVQLPRKRGGPLSEGFRIDDVDAFLARCADALEAYERGGPAPGLRVTDIVVQQFASRRFGEAYDPDAVDDFLDEVAVEIGRYETAD